MSRIRALNSARQGLSSARSLIASLGSRSGDEVGTSWHLSAEHAPSTVEIARHRPLDVPTNQYASSRKRGNPLTGTWGLYARLRVSQTVRAYGRGARQGAYPGMPSHTTSIQQTRTHTDALGKRTDRRIQKVRDVAVETDPEVVVRRILACDTSEEVWVYLDAIYLSIKGAYLVLQDLRKCGAQERCIDVGLWARHARMPLRNIHYTVLLGACRDLKDAEQAERFLHEMADDKQANLINFNAFFAVCATVRPCQNPVFL